MKKHIYWFLTLLLMSSSMVFAQSTVTGKVTDNTNNPLANAIVSVKGNATTVKTSDDGSFKIVTKENAGTVVVSFLGFEVSSVSFAGNQDLGTISLVLSTSEIEEVVVKSTTVDIAKSRKTPVAVSTIKASEIQEKLGNQEFPEMLNNTPSVYATKSGGGFGDSRVNIRGFNQNNIAVLINGVPVNDMENSAVYWSNWAGLSDVTSAMQVQRGLGSSKLAISSVGGTINVVTKSANQKEGGVYSSSIGNDDYFKNQLSYNTGKMKNGLSASFLMSRTTGDGYVDGTKFEGGNYFIGLGYELNDKHDFQFVFTGAPQWHNQRAYGATMPTIAQYIKYGNPAEMDPNIKYNSDWGMLKGEEYSFRTNFYHKPVMSLNWDYKISDKMKLSTVVYGSWGRGGGSNGTGAIRGNRFTDNNLKRPDGTINVDFIQGWNSGQAVTNGAFAPAPRTLTAGQFQNNNTTSNNGTNGISKISSINSHNWYGGIANLNTKLTDKLTLDFGVDVRTYRGIHYQVVNDLLGATSFNNLTGDVNNPGAVSNFQYATEPNLNPLWNTDYQKAINYNNDGLVKWFGAFTQLEYSTEKLTLFVQAAASQQGFKRVDYYKYLSSDPLSSTDYKNILGGNVKGGANYNIDEKNNVYVNAGYYSKQPFFNAIFINNASVINENLTNEKIMGLEAGYGFKSKLFSANVNVYRTTWKDRFIRLTSSINHDLNNATPAIPGSAFLEGVEQIHMGAELDFVFKPFKKLDVNGMFSYGDWRYGSNVTASYQDDYNAVITNPNTNEVFKETLYIDGLKVGDAAQTTAALGFSYEVLTRVRLDANYRYIDRLYAAIDPINFKNQAANDLGSLELPSYGLMDLGFSYKMLVGDNKQNSVNFRFNMNNVLNTTYIAESRTNQFVATQAEFNANSGNGAGLNPATGPKPYVNYQDYLNKGTYDGVDTRNQVFFGFGRTWNFTVTYKF
jgi:hypothetical protein